MARNKCKAIESHIGEVRCCAVAVSIDPTLLYVDAKPDELKTILNSIGKTLEKYENLGVQPNFALIICLFRDDKEQMAIDFIKDLENQKIEGIMKIQPVKNACYVDERYLDGEYKGVQSTLPPREVDEAIKNILVKYCLEWKFTTEPLADIFAYQGELGGGRNVHFIVQHGKRMAAGLDNLTVRVTENLVSNYKNLLLGVEKDIIEWSENHKGISKLYKGVDA